VGKRRGHGIERKRGVEGEPGKRKQGAGTTGRVQRSHQMARIKLNVQRNAQNDLGARLDGHTHKHNPKHAPTAKAWKSGAGRKYQGKGHDKIPRYIQTTFKEKKKSSARNLKKNLER